MSDLNDIIADVEPVEEEQAAQPEEQVEEVQEAAPEPEPVEVAPQAAEPEPDKPVETVQTVPLAAFLDMRKQVQELQQQLPKPEPVKPPDVFDDPQGFTGFITNQVQQQAMGQKLETSRFMAEREFGAETVQQAYAYFDANPHLSTALLNTPSPFHAAVDHYKKHMAAQEIGNDPAAYRERVRAEIEAEMVAKQSAAPAAPAPSLAASTSIGGRSSAVAPTQTPLDDLLS